MKRTIRKYYTLNRKEAEALKKKAKKTCRSEAALVRELVNGFEPREKPGDEFYDAMRTMSDFNEKMQIIVGRCRELDEGDAVFIKQEAKRWSKFQADIERRFLTPMDGVMRWQ